MIKVVIVDDEKTIRTGLTGLIDSIEGFEVTATCRTGAEALSLLETSVPDIIVTDIRMPKMDGIELMKRCQHMPNRPLLIIISGYPNFEYAQTAIQLEAFDYLLKPVDFDKLRYLLLKAADTIRKRKADRWLLMDQLGSLLAHPDAEEQLDQIGKLLDHIGFEWAGCPHMLVIDLLSEQVLSDEVTGEARAMAELLLDDAQTIHFRQGSRLGLILPSRYAAQSLEHISQKITSGIHAAYPTIRAVVGYGGTFQSSAQLIIASRQALTATYERFHQPDIRYMAYRHTRDDVSPFVHYLDRCLEEIGSAANHRDSDRALSAVERFAATFHSEDWPPVLLMELRRSLLQTIPSRESVQANSPTSFEAWHAEVVKLIEIYIRDQTKDTGPKYSSLVERAIRYIHSNYAKGITLQTVQDLFHVNASYFCKIFKTETGMTFIHFLNEVRIGKARELLGNRHLRTYEIASLAGFHSEKYFFKVFKEKTGKTPKEYVDSLT